MEAARAWSGAAQEGGTARSCTRAGRRRSWPRDGSELGWLGELHPLVLREWELDGPAAAFELDADRLLPSSLAGASRPTAT